MRRPDTLVLVAFVATVLIGGTNFVAVRLSNRELAPFWGAGLRFAIAALVLFAMARAMGVTLPRGRALRAVAVFGLLNFFASYALGYWALLEAPAALASTLVALVPLLTFAMAISQGMERFTWRGVAGGSVAVAGVGIVFADQLRAVPLVSVLALLLMAIAIAVSTIVAKRLPRLHPVATNAVAMVPGAAALVALSFFAGERPTLPTQPEVWLAVLYLATVGSVGLFIGFLYIVQRWTASATSYATVLFPIVTVALGAILAGELVSGQFLIGTLLVMVGVYLGALAQPGATAIAAPPARRGSAASPP